MFGRAQPIQVNLITFPLKDLWKYCDFRQALAKVTSILRSKAFKQSANLTQQLAIAINVKGDALYNLGNFEHALVNYYRAVKIATTKVCFSNF